MNDKIVVTNFAALIEKYGSGGLRRIKSALNGLIAADKRRGIATKIADLSSSASMARYGARPVADPGDQRGTKDAIDEIFRSTDPDYLMILGAPDVVCHQRLGNPANDEDRAVPSDLPYACDAPFSARIRSFTGPSRVVGRLPNVTGDTDASYLVKLLKTAASAKPRPYADYARCFAISAKVWEASTSLSLENVFGSSAGLKISPPAGPRWPGGDLSALSHFINCHGGEGDPQYYGDDGRSQPIAHVSRLVAGKIKVGTVATAECCYGAELYDAPTLELDAPIANTYLGDGALGFFGSSNIAYGPPEGNDQADLVCQFFLLRALSGSSLGRAALEARQSFISQAAELDPINLKTLAQFNLLGDPSLHPVHVPAPPGDSDAHSLERAGRRSHLKSVGTLLSATKPVVTTSSTRGIGRAQRSAIETIAKKAGISLDDLRSFKVKRPAGRRGAGKAAPIVSSYLVLFGQPKGPESPFTRACIVAKVAGGRVRGHRLYVRR